MRVLEAKDFLVQQTAEQAALENVPFSDLEKRMMYFTEGKGRLEDPVSLNNEFEAQYNTTEYEKKIRTLMGHAYSRIKKENEEKLRQWDSAVRLLCRGDHYILVLWGRSSAYNALNHWRLYVLVFAPGAALLLVGFLLFPRRNGTWPLSRYIPPPSPPVEHLLQAAFLALLVASIFFPKALAKVAVKCLSPLFKWADGPSRADDSEQ